MTKDSKEDLIERLRQDPENEELWAVYGDLLSDQEDERVEAVAVDVELNAILRELEALKERKEEITTTRYGIKKKAQERFFRDHPNLAPDEEFAWDIYYRPLWKYGSIQGIGIYVNRIIEETKDQLVELCASPYTQFMRELSFEREVGPVINELPFQETLETIATHWGAVERITFKNVPLSAEDIAYIGKHFPRVHTVEHEKVWPEVHHFIQDEEFIDLLDHMKSLKHLKINGGDISPAGLYALADPNRSLEYVQIIYNWTYWEGEELNNLLRRCGKDTLLHFCLDLADNYNSKYPSAYADWKQNESINTFVEINTKRAPWIVPEESQSQIERITKTIEV